jgi:hypothetical protein
MKCFFCVFSLDNVDSVCDELMLTITTIVDPGGGRGMAADEGLGSGSLAFSFEAPFEVG